MRTSQCPPEHKHASTPTCYRSHKCGCDDCRTANARRCYDRKKQIAYGRWNPDTTTSDEAHAHVVQLLAAGMTTGSIGRLAGVDVKTVRILAGADKTPRPVRIRKTTSTKILAVRVSLDAAPRSRVPSTGARRRLQALGTLGWCSAEIARRTGLHASCIDRALTSDFVTVRTHLAVGRVYEELWNQQAPANTLGERVGRTTALQNARTHRWLPPLAWDDIDTDIDAPIADDTFDVDEIAVELALAGTSVRLRPAELYEAVQSGTAQGLSLAALADRLGRSVRTIERLRSRTTPPPTNKATRHLVALAHTAFLSADPQYRGDCHLPTPTLLKLLVPAPMGALHLDRLPITETWGLVA